MCQLCMYVCIRTCSSVWVSEWLCVCVCVCVRRDLIVLMCRDELIMHAVCHSWMDTHTHTQTHIHTYTHTHTHTHTCTHTCTHTHTHTHTHTPYTHIDYACRGLCVSKCEGMYECVSECGMCQWVWGEVEMCQWVWGKVSVTDRRIVSVSVRRKECVSECVHGRTCEREREFDASISVWEKGKKKPPPLSAHCSRVSCDCKREIFSERVLKYCAFWDFFESTGNSPPFPLEYALQYRFACLQEWEFFSRESTEVLRLLFVREEGGGFV